jgi:hypothetical protein
VKHLFTRAEKFLCIDVSEDAVSAVRMKVYSSRKLLVINREEATHIPVGSREAIAALRKTVKRFGLGKQTNLLISFHSGLITAVHGAVVVVRERPKIPIDDPDLDNRIAKAMRKFFDRMRIPAAHKMNVSDLDAVLSDVMVKRVRLDGNRILNPVGFRAKTVEIQLIETIVPRFLGEYLKEIAPRVKTLFVTERGVARADLAAKIFEAPSSLLSEVLAKETHVFTADQGSFAHVATFAWGTRSIIASLEDAFAVDESVAVALLDIFLAGRASPPVLKALQAAITGECEQLAALLKPFFVRYGAEEICLNSPFSSPELIFGSRFRSAFGNRRPEITSLLDECMPERFGFSLAGRPHALVRPLISFFHFFFLPRDDRMNQVARRHARWLP